MQLARAETSQAERQGKQNVVRTDKQREKKDKKRGGDKIRNVDRSRNIVSTTNIVNPGVSDGSGDFGPVIADPEPVPVPEPIPVPVAEDEPVIVDPVPWPPAPQPVIGEEPSPNDLIATGVTDYSRGDYASAESRFQQALDILEGTQGSNPRLIANALENLANVYDKTGRTTEAERARERARSIRQIS